MLKYENTLVYIIIIIIIIIIVMYLINQYMSLLTTL